MRVWAREILRDRSGNFHGLKINLRNYGVKIKMSKIIAVKPCKKFDFICHKVKMVLDKDILDPQKVEALSVMCDNCVEREG